MKKKLLFINKSFEFGGIQSALSNLLGAISAEYDIDIAIFNDNGPFRQSVPENVKLVELHPFVRVLGMNKQDTSSVCTFSQKFLKYFLGVWTMFFGNKLPVSFLLAFQKRLGPYDAVISYHQETSAKTLVTGFGRFALEKCDAKKKIAWVHSDFQRTRLATAENHETYRKFDLIICVSQSCMKSFLNRYPDLAPITDFCYNILPSQAILDKAEEKAEVIFDEDKINILSVGRMTKEKGFAEAAAALAPILKNHSNITWYIIGNGPEESAITELVLKEQLSDRIILTGFKDNPYPYIKAADYILIPSFHETFSMVAAEAHLLNTRVIARDIDIMREVCDPSSDIICDITPESLSQIQWIKKEKQDPVETNISVGDSINMFRSIVE
ncbi:MAG: glycosyltransferase [Abditibacteriota bacterium]|nr:glycosyltransferase [Abditibacteriota bacterium]